MAIVTQNNTIIIRGPLAERPDSTSVAETNTLYFATDVQQNFGTGTAASFILVENIIGPTGIKSWVPFSGCCDAPTGGGPS